MTTNMRCFACLRLGLLPALLAVVTMPAARAQTKSDKPLAISQSANSSNSAQPAPIQGVAAEVDVFLDTSVRADVQQFSDTDGPWNPDPSRAVRPSNPQAAHPTKAATANQWSPQRTPNLSQALLLSPSRTSDPIATTALPIVAEPPPAGSLADPPDALGMAQTIRAAHARQQQEARKKQAAESRRRFLRACSELGLPEFECRLNLKSRIGSSAELTSKPVSNGKSGTQR